jgi:hypothetical protein
MNTSHLLRGIECEELDSPRVTRLGDSGGTHPQSYPAATSLCSSCHCQGSTTRAPHRDGGSGCLPPDSGGFVEICRWVCWCASLSTSLAAVRRGGRRRTMTSVLSREDNGRLLGVVRRAAMSPLRSRVDPRSWWPGMGHHISRREDLVAPSRCAAVTSQPPRAWRSLLLIAT